MFLCCRFASEFVVTGRRESWPRLPDWEMCRTVIFGRSFVQTQSSVGVRAV